MAKVVTAALLRAFSVATVSCTIGEAGSDARRNYFFFPQVVRLSGEHFLFPYLFSPLPPSKAKACFVVMDRDWKRITEMEENKPE